MLATEVAAEVSGAHTRRLNNTMRTLESLPLRLVAA
jgi:hypothetical protein